MDFNFDEKFFITLENKESIYNLFKRMWVDDSLRMKYFLKIIEFIKNNPDSRYYITADELGRLYDFVELEDFIEMKILFEDIFSREREEL